MVNEGAQIFWQNLFVCMFVVVFFKKKKLHSHWRTSSNQCPKTSAQIAGSSLKNPLVQPLENVPSGGGFVVTTTTRHTYIDKRDPGSEACCEIITKRLPLAMIMRGPKSANLLIVSRKSAFSALKKTNTLWQAVVETLNFQKLSHGHLVRALRKFQLIHVLRSNSPEMDLFREFRIVIYCCQMA